jgi:hypothetical protein
MNSVFSWLMSANGRRWIYGVAGAAIVLLGIYGVVTNEQGIAWLALVAAAVGLAAPATALTHITPDPIKGEVVTDEPPPPGVVVASEPEPEQDPEIPEPRKNL